MEHLAHQQVDGLLVVAVVEHGTLVTELLEVLAVLVVAEMVLLVHLHQQQEQMALEVVVEEVLNRNKEVLVVMVLLLFAIVYSNKYIKTNFLR
jgi:hypothetical protein